MGPNLVHFDDSLECPVCVEATTWYTCTRRGSCCCEHWYDPALNCQRYCTSCKTWWRVQCIRSNNDKDDDPDFTVSDSDSDESDDKTQADLLRLDDARQVEAILSQFLPSTWKPIVRGFHGKYDKCNTWLISGSGTQVKNLRDWATTGVPSNDWEEILGTGFLTDCLTKKEWVRYSCLRCHKDI